MHIKQLKDVKIKISVRKFGRSVKWQGAIQQKDTK
jgi:hypothetical protein